MNTAQGKEVELSHTPQKMVLEKNGRDFDRISVHPNNEDWLFTECSNELNPEGDCHVLKYNINTKQLTRYVLPDGYVYSYASFSPNGTYIVLSRVRKHDGQNGMVPKSEYQGEIAILRSDGSSFRVLPIAKGHNLAPIMSENETKIAYWRSSVERPPGSKSSLADFDIREYDLNTQHDGLFAGPYHFFEGGNSQYISENEILLGSYGPKKHAQSMSEYQKKFNGSQVYKLRRGMEELPNPSHTNIAQARNPSADKQGNIYLEGQYPNGGSTISQLMPSGNINYWTEPINFTNFRHLVVAPNGRYLAFVYVAEGTRYREQKSALGLLNFDQSKWLSIFVPPLQTSVPLLVKTSAD